MIQFLTENTLFALFLLLLLGNLLGSLSWRGISLGASAVLLMALIFGHFGVKIPQELTDLGLTLFVYAIGLQAGPGFFKALKEQGKVFVIVSLTSLVVALSTTIAVSKLFIIPPDITTGLFAGGLTNTPALAAALELAGKLGLNANNISVGYGIAYPFSVVCVVLIIQLLPKILRGRFVQAEQEWNKQHLSNNPILLRKHFRLENPNCFGKTLVELHPHAFGKINISRIFRDNTFIAAKPDTKLQKNDIITIIGLPEDIEKGFLVFGKEEDILLLDSGITGRDVNVFSSKFIGKQIKALHIWRDYNIIISRIKRRGDEIAPMGTYELEYGDILHIVGDTSDVDQFAKLISDLDDKTQEITFLPFLLGLVIGIGLGSLPIPLVHGIQIKLGTATGAFLISLFVGYVRKFGPLRLYVPQAASNLSRELGLMLFLAGAGTAAGAQFVQVIQERGFTLFIAGAIITTVTIAITLILLIFSKNINFFSITGGLSGLMTNPSALAAAKSQTETAIPMLGYATIFPFAMILKIAFIQVLMVIILSLK